MLLARQTAASRDVDRRIGDRLVVFIVAVVALSFLLLTVVFRSLLVPLKPAIFSRSAPRTASSSPYSSGKFAASKS